MGFLCDQLSSHVSEASNAHHQQALKFAEQVNIASATLAAAKKQVETLAIKMGDLVLHAPLERVPAFSQDSVFKAPKQDRLAPAPTISKAASILTRSKFSTLPGTSLPKAPDAAIELTEIDTSGSYYSEDIYMEVGDSTVLLVHTATPRLESLSTLVGHKKALARLILQRPISELFEILDKYPGWPDVVGLEDVEKKSKKLRAMFPPSKNPPAWRFFQRLG